MDWNLWEKYRRERKAFLGGTLYIEIRKSNGEIVKVFHCK